METTVSEAAWVYEGQSRFSGLCFFSGKGILRTDQLL